MESPAVSRDHPVKEDMDDSIHSLFIMLLICVLKHSREMALSAEYLCMASVTAPHTLHSQKTWNLSI